MPAFQHQTRIMVLTVFSIHVTRTHERTRTHSHSHLHLYLYTNNTYLYITVNWCEWNCLCLNRKIYHVKNKRWCFAYNVFLTFITNKVHTEPRIYVCVCVCYINEIAWRQQNVHLQHKILTWVLHLMMPKTGILFFIFWCYSLLVCFIRCAALPWKWHYK